ncbi:TPA: hypothetical protein KQW76_002756 [Clostridioides difficile]|nr:hypothetical protein [Clostridioides difficile]EJA6691745.1 hypothetical protein [Clostridioides difficile]EQH51450.1 hypothetical protein QMG_3597 [Clostridioides difficile DA00256]MCA0587048.1 hypothetical protein [Clostridioides difficile]MDO0484842.1 hypothetical protein [Clostridioides difficile]MDV9238821.1 hypothetical protein [Clostridioides difficile]
MNIDLFRTKSKLLNYIREEIDDEIKKIEKSSVKKSIKSSKVNKLVLNEKEKLLNDLMRLIKTNKLNNSEVLDCILLLNYCIYVVMLEARNTVWEYDYMAFSRRIGELWEPFAKLPFEMPVKNIKIIKPESFIDFKNKYMDEVNKYIMALNINKNEKETLMQQYNTVWGFVDSGSIQLKLDLHFTDGNKKYNIDYKSGFSSNEKGNTNRLLTVASILKMIDENNKQLIFVRQEEEENNHYLQTLKNSGLFEVYCGDETYNKIYEFTGYNIKKWIQENMKWEEDISKEFKKYLEDNDLLKYLRW